MTVGGGDYLPGVKRPEREGGRSRLSTAGIQTKYQTTALTYSWLCPSA